MWVRCWIGFEFEVMGRQGVTSKEYHKGDSQYPPNVGEYFTGNFTEVLNYNIRGRNKDLENHLNKMTYSSAVVKLFRKIFCLNKMIYSSAVVKLSRKIFCKI